ncbi:MAG: phosphotransferase [Actinomycetota bacterium]|nr:phosphotransferase [Actinomycetota bacterium]
MTALAVPRGAGDLTASWLSAALAGVADSAVVTEVSAVAVGNGMVADSVRLVLTWDRPTSAPLSVVAKVAAAEETSRAAAAATRTYEIEAGFYNHLAPTVAVHRPACYLSRFDPDSGNYVVLLEDLAPAEAGDQITGCGVEDAAAAIPELAALHGPRWADPTLLDMAWLDRPAPESARRTAELLAMLYTGFVERYANRLEPDVLPLCERLMASLEGYLAYRPPPWTVTHGDFRLDNLLFGGPRVAVLDWQTVKVGPAISDLSYFVGSALLPEARRTHEQALVRLYHEGLRSAGVDMTWDACWDAYRRYSFDGMVMGIAASMLVGRTERGDAMFMAMVNRHGRQALDLEAARLLVTTP